jgi:hypothetical protein
MATFYILPSRSSLEQSLSEVLSRLLPGLTLPLNLWDIMVDRIASTAQWSDDVYLVPRDDLPEGNTIGEALSAGYGAECGDRVVEIHSMRGPAIPRFWVLDEADVSSTVTAR